MSVNGTEARHHVITLGKPKQLKRPQLAKETSGPRSSTVISAVSQRRRARAAQDAPAATPPMTSSFMAWDMVFPFWK